MSEKRIFVFSVLTSDIVFSERRPIQKLFNTKFFYLKIIIMSSIKNHINSILGISMRPTYLKYKSYLKTSRPKVYEISDTFLVLRSWVIFLILGYKLIANPVFSHSLYFNLHVSWTCNELPESIFFGFENFFLFGIIHPFLNKGRDG